MRLIWPLHFTTHFVSLSTEPYINYKNTANLTQWLKETISFMGNTNFTLFPKPFWLLSWVFTAVKNWLAYFLKEKQLAIWYLFDVFFPMFKKKNRSPVFQYISILLHDHEEVGVYSDFVKGFHAQPRNIFESDLALSLPNMRKHGQSVLEFCLSENRIERQTGVGDMKGFLISFLLNDRSHLIHLRSWSALWTVRMYWSWN